MHNRCHAGSEVFVIAIVCGLACLHESENPAERVLRVSASALLLENGLGPCLQSERPDRDSFAVLFLPIPSNHLSIGMRFS